MEKFEDTKKKTERNFSTIFIENCVQTKNENKKFKKIKFANLLQNWLWPKKEQNKTK